VANTIGSIFLLPEEKRELESKHKEEVALKTALENRATKKLRPLWYFVVSLCRVLQTADHELTAVDAYWLGLVDEVPGSGLPNLRQSLMKIAETENKAISEKSNES